MQTIESPAAPIVLPVDLPPAPPDYIASPFKTRLVNFIAVVLPFAGLIAAAIMLWGVAFSWVYLVVLLTMYVLTAGGITVGFHRLFTHCSFKTSKPIAYLLAVFGSMAVQGPLFEWVATHRRHHQCSDDEGDPHSPHHHGDTVVGVIRGMWHAHLGWLFVRYPHNLGRYTRDLRADPMLRNVHAYFALWVALGLILPAVIAGLWTQSWMGILLGFIWGGLVRVFLVHHVTWSINSVCHIWGAQPFRNKDESRNNVIFGVLALGEGWHNNHHAFPTSARHGLAWWQFDASYLFIRGMQLVGLAREVRVPTPERMAAKRLRSDNPVDHPSPTNEYVGGKKRLTADVA